MPKVWALHYGRSTKPLALVKPDETWPTMWRIHWPDGRTSDMVNLSRAKDAASAIAATGPPELDKRRFNWRIKPPADEIPARPDAFSSVPATHVAPNPENAASAK
jgi:hypothetical protein